METPEKKEPEKKGFWKKLVEKFDKKLEEKSKKGSCCSGSSDKKDPCCG